MTAISGSIQILSKTNAELTALGSPWIPLHGHWFYITDQGKIGIGDGTTAYSSLVKVQLANVEDTANKATDFLTVNNTKYPTVQAVVNYVTALVAGLWDDRGNFDASGNVFPSSGGSGTAGAILKGDIWTVSVIGTLGGSAVGLGDTVRALTDTPGQTASNWAIAENNIGYTPEQILSFTGPLQRVVNTVSIDPAGAITDGYLTAADWTTFNNKQPSDAELTSLAGLGVVQGDLIFASAPDTYSRLAKDANATRYLSNTGASNDPAWAQVDLTNGVTGILPVANGGTGTAFGNSIKMIGADFTPVATTATTSEELLHSHSIGAGIVTVGSIMDVFANFLLTGSINNKTFRIYVNTSASLSGATLLSTFTTSGLTVVTSFISRILVVISDTLIEILGAPTTSLASNFSQSSVANSQVTVPSLTAGFFIIISGQKASAGETLTARWSKSTLFTAP